MGCTSAARIAANRRNALLSTGPKTAAGKARARANAVKHGLTGAGIALPGEDAAVVEGRFLDLQEDLAPSGLAGGLLVRQVALMSVRIDRAAQQESAALALLVRHALSEYDIERANQIDQWFGAIETNPGEHRRRLLASPEGVDRLLDALQSVRDQVVSGAASKWGDVERRKVDAFLGGSWAQFPVARSDALLQAMQGNFVYLAPGEIDHVPKGAPRREWVRAELIGLVDAERARLSTIRAEFDPAVLAADRREAAARALFTSAPDATLARKYEAAATRNLLRALRDFHDLPTVVDQDPSAPPTGTDPAAAPVGEIPPLGPACPVPDGLPVAEPLPIVALVEPSDDATISASAIASVSATGPATITASEPATEDEHQSPPKPRNVRAVSRNRNREAAPASVRELDSIVVGSELDPSSAANPAPPVARVENRTRETPKRSGKKLPNEPNGATSPATVPPGPLAPSDPEPPRSVAPPLPPPGAIEPDRSWGIPVYHLAGS